MYIHFGKIDGHLQSIELAHVTKHKALPHLNHWMSHKNSHFKTLKKIHIEKSMLNTPDILALENIMNHCEDLTIVELDSNHLETQHAQELLHSLAINHLHSLSFTDNWIGEKISADFFRFMKNQNNMDALNFSLNWLRDKGIARLIESLETNLKSLYLSCNDFHAAGMHAVSDFAINNPHLIEIDVSYNHLDIKAAKHIADMIKKNKKIAAIKVNSNQLDDNSAKIIATALTQKAAPMSIDLSDNNISTQGAKYLIDSILQDGMNRDLDLRYNPIDKEDLTSLVKRQQEYYPLSHIVL